MRSFFRLFDGCIFGYTVYRIGQGHAHLAFEFFTNDLQQQLKAATCQRLLQVNSKVVGTFMSSTISTNPRSVGVCYKGKTLAGKKQTVGRNLFATAQYFSAGSLGTATWRPWFISLRSNRLHAWRLGVAVWVLLAQQRARWGFVWLSTWGPISVFRTRLRPPCLSTRIMARTSFFTNVRDDCADPRPRGFNQTFLSA